MAKLGISTGTTPNDGTGDNLLSGAVKINANFSEIYSAIGDGTNITNSINYASISGIATYATKAGIATYATNAGIATNVIGGIASVTQLRVFSGITTLGITSATNLTAQQLNVSGLSTFSGIATHTASLFGTTASFTGVITASSFGGNASSATYATNAGIATYATNAGIATYATTSGISTVSQGLTGTPNITVGIVTATSFFGSGTNLTGIVTSIVAGTGVTISGSTGQVTINATGTNYWSQTSAGINTLSNVGIGTTNPTNALTVGAVGSATTNLVVNGFAKIDQIVVKNNSNSYQDNIIMTQHPAGTFTGGRNVAIGDYSFTTPGAANENVAIGYYALNVLGNNDTLNVYSGNTALGCFSGQSSTYTLRNTLIGYKSGQFITTGDTNTILGAYDGNQNGLDIRTSDGNVVLSDGDGNIRFYANSSGNVGIGTTNPTSALTVKGTTSLETLTVTGGSGDTTNIQGGVISFNSNGSITQTGSQHLHRSSSSGGGSYYFSDYYVGTDHKIIYADGGKVELYSSDSKKFETIGTGVTVTGTTFTNQLSVSGVTTTATLNVGTGGTVITTTTTGLVGINSTAPAYTLDVSGNARVGINTSQGVILTSPDGTKYRLFVENGGTLKTIVVP